MCIESWKWLNFTKFNKNYRNKNCSNLSFQRPLIDVNDSAQLSLYPIYLIEMVFSHCDMAVSHFSS